MNVDMFTQQVEIVHRRLDKLYQGVNGSVQPQTELLPVAFKELGIVSEELQVAVDELQQQNEELAVTRAVVEAERRRYQDLFEFAPDGYLVTDVNGTIQEANRAAVALLNVSQRFLVGKPLIVFVTEEERQTFHSQLSGLQKAEQMQEWIVRLCPRNGQPFDAALTVGTVLDWQGKVVGLRVCMRYISDTARQLRLHKQAEAQLETEDNDNSQDRPKHVYLKGEIIPLKPQNIWQVCQGIVKLSTMSENGEEVLVGLAGPSMAFGPDWTSLQTYQATALSSVQLVCFSLADIATSPTMAQTFLPLINKRLRQTEAFLAVAGQRRVKDRFLHLLHLLKQEIGHPVAQGTRLSVRFTHQELADACSTTRVTITRLLGKLQDQGTITFDSKNHIVVKDHDCKSAFNEVIGSS